MDPIYVQAAEPLLQYQARTLQGVTDPQLVANAGDQVTLSAEARRYAVGVSPIGESDGSEMADLFLLEESVVSSLQGLEDEGIDASGTVDETETMGASSTDESESSEDSAELTSEEKTQVVRLQARDAEVRAHETAHIMASGGMAGGASYTYATGPDGKRYAIGGEVSISSLPTSDPKQALRNAQRMRAAALAPANPSGQDRAVAARAASTEARARVAIASEEEAVREASESDEGTTQSTSESEETVELEPTRIEPARMGGVTAFGPAEHLHSDGCEYCSASAARYRLGV